MIDLEAIRARNEEFKRSIDLLGTPEGDEIPTYTDDPMGQLSYPLIAADIDALIAEVERLRGRGCPQCPHGFTEHTAGYDYIECGADGCHCTMDPDWPTAGMGT